MSRLGELPEETSRTEQLQALHGLASECGFKGEDIPVPKDNYPSDISDFQECIGLNYQLPGNFNVDDIREDAKDDDEDELELADFLKDMDFEVEVDMDKNTSFVDPPDDDDEDPFAINATLDLSLFEPTIVPNESTYATFVRLTEEQPWVPFKDP